MDEQNLINYRKQFAFYKQLADKTFDQLSDDELFKEIVPGINSIAIICQHISGNMKSRWTDFLHSDGEKSWRNRDSEFEAVISDKKNLVQLWEEGWNCLFGALNELSDKDLDRIVYIRNQGHRVVEAINRQLAHYAYHIGQIVFVGRMIRNDKWQSLSIPKGESKNFNKDKFSKQKRREHFTQQFLNEDKNEEQS